jgi:uncharacterized membrane protein
MQFWQILGDLHIRLVQFPLVLLLSGLLFDCIGLFTGKPVWHFSARVLSGAGTCFLLVAFICGIYAEVWAGRAGIPQEQIEMHELMANIASWGFVVLMAWRIFLSERTPKSLAFYVIVGLSWYCLLVITGYFGGELVLKYGAAVTGAQANNVISLHDLNALATRQTDENLRYSELMHHVSGWLTLALSGSLFAYALFPNKADKMKWVGPTLLLLGGISLFFFADLDLYRFTDLRQLRDREVQLHKTLSIILFCVGAMGLYRMRKKHAAISSDAKSPDAKSLDAKSQASRATPSGVVAVMALIGGGMLFTHVHTVAPYANVAAGVYIAHIVMGLTALGIGAARLLQDALPRQRRFFAVVFAALMCVESVLLITYNEGLPWYIGYGHYNRWGSHTITGETASLDPSWHSNGTIAPYGPIRAELTFDPSNQKLDLYVMDRMTTTPVPVSAKQVNALISLGYNEFSVPLAAEGDAPSASHFTATAPFLKNTLAFSVRAALPIGSSTKMGYFDPWVTNLIQPVPPNEVPTWQCPMHDGIIATQPGTCPLCQMKLVPYRVVPATELHLPDYDMKLDVKPAVDPPSTQPAPVPSTVTAGQLVNLTFTPLHNGQLFRDLMVVHEHLLHLIVVSADLNYFDHVHPVMQPDGSLTLPYTFPHSGQYLLYADVTPTGQRGQVFRLPVNVEPPPNDPELITNWPPLTPDPTFAKALPDDPETTVQLFFEPRLPVSGLENHFLFRLIKDGRPVNDLEPYIGAMGHCVIISEDTQTYLHCHPEQLFTPGKTMRGGPDVPFATVFPHPGLYKIWGQFRRGNKILIASFVVDVKAPILPPKILRFLLDG